MVKSTKSEKKSFILFRLTKEDHKRFKIYCVKNGMPMQKVFENLLFNLIKE